VPGQKIAWASGVIADGPFAGQKVYCENRIGSTVHFRAGVTYEVVTLADVDHPASLEQTSTQVGLT